MSLDRRIRARARSAEDAETRASSTHSSTIIRRGSSGSTIRQRVLRAHGRTNRLSSFRRFRSRVTTSSRSAFGQSITPASRAAFSLPIQWLSSWSPLITFSCTSADKGSAGYPLFQRAFSSAASGGMFTARPQNPCGEDRRGRWTRPANATSKKMAPAVYSRSPRPSVH